MPLRTLRLGTKTSRAEKFDNIFFLSKSTTLVILILVSLLSKCEDVLVKKRITSFQKLQKLTDTVWFGGTLVNKHFLSY
jgi:hypothetical protein